LVKYQRDEGKTFLTLSIKATDSHKQSYKQTLQNKDVLDIPILKMSFQLEDPEGIKIVEATSDQAKELMEPLITKQRKYMNGLLVGCQKRMSSFS
jgi:hypothetical protein